MVAMSYKTTDTPILMKLLYAKSADFQKGKGKEALSL